MYYVYILKSKNFSKSYVGYTENLQKRLQEHNAGKSLYTRRYVPWSIIYIEQFTNKNEAIAREQLYKTKLGRKMMEKIFSSICPVV